MGGKLGGAGDAGSLGCWYVKLVASVVFHRWADVPGFFAMGRPALSRLGVFEDEGAGAGWGEGCFIEIEETEDLGMG